MVFENKAESGWFEVADQGYDELEEPEECPWYSFFPDWMFECTKEEKEIRTNTLTIDDSNEIRYIRMLMQGGRLYGGI